MTKLFIANCTTKRWSFYYRIPEAPSTREQPIDIGHQIQIAGDLSQKDVDAIIDQYRVYGMIECRQKPPQGFVGLCYSIDKPIPSTPIQDLIIHNQEIMTDIGRRLRQQAAVEVNKSAEDAMRRFGNPKDTLSELEFDIAEQATVAGDSGDKLHENTIVARGGSSTKDAGGRRGRRGRAAA